MGAFPFLKQGILLCSEQMLFYCGWQINTGRLRPRLVRWKGSFLTWLIWLSNTLHPTLRMLFYPEKSLDRPKEENLQDLRKTRKRSLLHLLTPIDQEIGSEDSHPLNSCLNIFQLYLVVCLQWIALFPLADAKEWFDLSTWPNLFKRC